MTGTLFWKMKIQRLGALEMIPPKCSCLLNVSYVIDGEENLLFPMLFVYLVDENFLINILFDIIILKTANSLFKYWQSYLCWIR